MSSDFVPALRIAALTRFYDPVVRLTTRERRVKQALITGAEIGHADGSVVMPEMAGGGMSIDMMRLQSGESAFHMFSDPMEVMAGQMHDNDLSP